MSGPNKPPSLGQCLGSAKPLRALHCLACSVFDHLPSGAPATVAGLSLKQDTHFYLSVFGPLSFCLFPRIGRSHLREASPTIVWLYLTSSGHDLTGGSTG